MSNFDFEANRGNVPKNTGFDFEANRKPVPEPLPFNKPFDFEANRGNIPKPATIRYDFANNPESYKPRGQTITIVEDENRERNSWGYNSMLAGTTLLGVGAILSSQMYQIYKGVNRARGEMRQPRFASMDRAKGVIKEKIIEEGGRIPQRITQSQILTPLGGVDTTPDRGLVNNPQAEKEAQGIVKDLLARTFTTLDNKNRQQPRKNEFAGVPKRGGEIPKSKDYIRNTKFFEDMFKKET